MDDIWEGREDSPLSDPSWATYFSREIDTWSQKSELNQDSWDHFSINEQPLSLWYKANQTPYIYGSSRTYSSREYDNNMAAGQDYTPWSAFTHNIINQDIAEWLGIQHPEWDDWTSGGGGYGNVGKVYEGAWGIQSLTPEIRNEVQWAAERHGVPVNFLLTILMQEGSADWETNNFINYKIRPESGGILPFVGIFENAAKYWGLYDLWTTGAFGSTPEIKRQAQIEMLASLLRKFYGYIRGEETNAGQAYANANTDYGWMDVASYHFSGKPMDGGGFTDELGMTTSLYITTAINRWKRWDEEQGNTWSNYSSLDQTPGIASPQDMEWGPLAQYDAYLVDKAYETGASANMLKALLKFGFDHGTPWTADQFDPIVNQLADSYRFTGDWNESLNAVTQSLGYTSAPSLFNDWTYLNSWGAQTQGGGQSTQISSIWGGGDFGISQEFGPTDFARSHPTWYDYAVNYGMTEPGHTGIDYSMPIGTMLYTPVSGNVVLVSNAFFADESSSNARQRGQLMIEMTNGDRVILGHMSAIDVNLGAIVQAGQYVGKSGIAGTGAHLHLEYRIRDGSTISGWRLVDPRQYLGGAGFANQKKLTGLGHNVPFTFQNLMKTAASGQPIPAGAVYSQTGTGAAWNRWLREAAMGSDPSTRVTIDYSKLYPNISGV